MSQQQQIKEALECKTRSLYSCLAALTCPYCFGIMAKKLNKNKTCDYHCEKCKITIITAREV